MMQVTFVPEVPPPPSFKHTLELGGKTFVLYSYSFLNYGQVCLSFSRKMLISFVLLFSVLLRPSWATALATMYFCQRWNLGQLLEDTTLWPFLAAKLMHIIWERPTSGISLSKDHVSDVPRCFSANVKCPKIVLGFLIQELYILTTASFLGFLITGISFMTTQV